MTCNNDSLNKQEIELLSFMMDLSIMIIHDNTQNSNEKKYELVRRKMYNIFPSLGEVDSEKMEEKVESFICHINTNGNERRYESSSKLLLKKYIARILDEVNFDDL